MERNGMHRNDIDSRWSGEWCVAGVVYRMCVCVPESVDSCVYTGKCIHPVGKEIICSHGIPVDSHVHMNNGIAHCNNNRIRVNVCNSNS